MESEEKFYRFDLERILPPDQYIVMYPEKGYIVLLDKEGLIEIEHLTDLEFAITLVLHRSYPYYAPLEDLYAAYQWGGEVTDQKRTKARNVLQDAMEHGGYDQTIRPVRNAISRCQIFKLRHLGIRVSSMLETGYILVSPHAARVPAAAGKE